MRRNLRPSLVLLVLTTMLAGCGRREYPDFYANNGSATANNGAYGLVADGTPLSLGIGRVGAWAPHEDGVAFMWSTDDHFLRLIDGLGAMTSHASREIGGLLQSSDGSLVGCYAEGANGYIATWDGQDWTADPGDVVGTDCAAAEGCWDSLDPSRCRLFETSEILAAFEAPYGDADAVHLLVGGRGDDLTPVEGLASVTDRRLSLLGFGWDSDPTVLFYSDEGVHFADTANETGGLMFETDVAERSDYARSADRTALAMARSGDWGYEIFSDGIGTQLMWLPSRNPPTAAPVEVAIAHGGIVVAYAHQGSFVINWEGEDFTFAAPPDAEVVDVLSTDSRVYLVYSVPANGSEERELFLGHYALDSRW